MKKLLITITAMVLMASFSVTSHAWLTELTREEYNAPRESGVIRAKESFVDKGLPAPIVKDPVPYAVPGRINITLNGEYQYFYDKPVNSEGRILLPFRELFEFFSLNVSWDDETKTATARNEETEIKVTVGNKTAYVNGEAKELDVPSKIINSKTYAPMRFVAEALGYNVDWDQQGQTVILRSGGKK